MPEITTSEAHIEVSDGTAMGAYVARPSSKAPAPGIMVFQEAYGVNSHIRDVANRLAREGFVAVAPDLYHRTAPGFQGDYKNFASAMPHIQALTPAKLSADLTATYDWLKNKGATNGALSAIGFCLGGRCAFLANSLVPLKAAVSFYGGRIAPDLLDRASSQNGPLVLFWGGLDQHIGPEQRRAVADALTEAKKDFVEVNFSKADHGFFCNERASHNATAAAEAWALTLRFLKTHLGQES